jgi:hypothetical protein
MHLNPTERIIRRRWEFIEEVVKWKRKLIRVESGFFSGWYMSIEKAPLDAVNEILCRFTNPNSAAETPEIKRWLMFPDTPHAYFKWQYSSDLTLALHDYYQVYQVSYNVRS